MLGQFFQIVFRFRREGNEHGQLKQLDIRSGKRILQILQFLELIRQTERNEVAAALVVIFHTFLDLPLHVEDLPAHLFERLALVDAVNVLGYRKLVVVVHDLRNERIIQFTVIPMDIHDASESRSNLHFLALESKDGRCNIVFQSAASCIEVIREQEINIIERMVILMQHRKNFLRHKLLDFHIQIAEIGLQFAEILEQDIDIIDFGFGLVGQCDQHDLLGASLFGFLDALIEDGTIIIVEITIFALFRDHRCTQLVTVDCGIHDELLIMHICRECVQKRLIAFVSVLLLCFTQQRIIEIFKRKHECILIVPDQEQAVLVCLDERDRILCSFGDFHTAGEKRFTFFFSGQQFHQTCHCR